MSHLLEQYIFNVAGRVIEFVDGPQQTQLIQLIHSIDSSDRPVTAEPTLNSLQPPNTEWQLELDKPLDLASVHLQWCLGVIRHRIRRDELYITRLETALLAIQHRYEFGQTLLDKSRHQSIWRHLVSQYQHYLTQARESRQRSMAQLIRLSK